MGETLHFPVLRMYIFFPSLIDSEAMDLPPTLNVVNEWCGVVAARSIASNTALQPDSPACANPEVAQTAAAAPSVNIARRVVHWERMTSRIECSGSKKALLERTGRARQTRHGGTPGRPRGSLAFSTETLRRGPRLRTPLVNFPASGLVPFVAAREQRAIEFHR
jgi:hypothetical protein